MALYGFGGKEELPADGSVGATLRDKLKYLLLSLGEMRRVGTR